MDSNEEIIIEFNKKEKQRTNIKQREFFPNEEIEEKAKKKNVGTIIPEIPEPNNGEEGLLNFWYKIYRKYQKK